MDRDPDKNRFLELALDGTNTGTWEWVLTAERPTWDERLERLFGYDEDAPRTYQGFVDRIHPADRSDVEAALERALDGGVMEVEFRVFVDGETKRWVKARTEVVCDDGGPARMLGIVSGLPKRLQTERDIEALNRRLTLALEGTNTGVWEWDMRTDDLIWDEQMERLFGYEPGGFPGNYEGFRSRVHPDDLPGMEASHEVALEEGFHQYEYRVHVDGETLRWVNARGEIFYDDDDEPVRMVGIVTDITDHKETERQLKAQTEQLDEFAGIVSHDLRSPLSVAKGNLAIHREDSDLDRLDRVDDALDRMETLIEKLLTLAREGEAVDETEPVELQSTARRAWDAVDSRDATLTTTDEPVVEADAVRLQQLLENLFRNAVEHGGEDVTVTVGELADGFYVEDDGPGIPADECSDVLEAGYSTTPDGTGFGLSIVSTIAEAHEWELDVTEGADGGARFEVTGVAFSDD